MAKYYLFTTALEQGYIWLILIAILGSAVSAAYYFKPIVAMYLKEGDGIKLEAGYAYKIHVVFLTVLILVLGLFPVFLMNLL
jgi:NADH-quinone oxidoreductase subunit N